MGRPARAIRSRWLSTALSLCLAPLALGAAPAPLAKIALPGDQAFPESISAASDGTLYVGSVVAGGVFRVKPGQSAAQRWIAPGAFESRSIFGVLVDERSGTLWVCSNDLSGAGVLGPGTESGSSVKGFDLRTGVGMLTAKMPGGPNQCNDMAVGPDGALYVTNTAAPEIFRLPPGGRDLQLWLRDVRFSADGGGLDGIAFDGPDSLYVDTFMGGGLYRIALDKGQPGRITKLTTSKPFMMPDALKRIAKSTFLLVEGGGRLDRLVVNGDTASVATIRPDLNGPTGVAMHRSIAWVTEGQLSYIFNPAKKGQNPVLPFDVLPIPIEPR